MDAGLDPMYHILYCIPNALSNPINFWSFLLDITHIDLWSIFIYAPFTNQKWKKFHQFYDQIKFEFTKVQRDHTISRPKLNLLFFRNKKSNYCQIRETRRCKITPAICIHVGSVDFFCQRALPRNSSIRNFFWFRLYLNFMVWTEI